MRDKISDIELIRRIIQENDAKAFEIFVERYRSLVWQCAITLTKDSDMAAEVLQLSFIKIWQRLSSWRGENLKSWISVITNHIALDFIEKEKKLKQEPLNDSVVVIDEDDYEHREECLRKLENAITSLTNEEQELIELYYQKQIPIKDIAKKQGKTPNSIAVRMHQIRQKLKNLINNEK